MKKLKLTSIFSWLKPNLEPITEETVFETPVKKPLAKKAVAAKKPATKKAKAPAKKASPKKK